MQKEDGVYLNVKRTNARKTKLECKRKKIKNIKYYFNLYT